MYNRDRLIKDLFSYLLLFTILFVEGCFNFLTFKFELGKVLTSSFWVDIFMRILLLVLIRSIALLIFTDKARENNTDLFDAIKKNKQLIGLKDIDFPYWCENVKNRELIIANWKFKINKKIARLERRTSFKTRSVYYSNNEIEKSVNKYCVQRKKLEFYLTDEYIEKNFDLIKSLKCKKVDPAVFDLPVNFKSTNKDYQFVAKNKTAILSILGGSAFGLTIITIIRQALEFNYDKSQLLPILVGLCLDLIFMGYQFVMGMMDSYSIVNEQEVLPYTNRNRILTEYLKSKNQYKDKIEIIFEKLENC